MSKFQTFKHIGPHHSQKQCFDILKFQQILSRKNELVVACIVGSNSAENEGAEAMTFAKSEKIPKYISRDFDLKIKISEMLRGGSPPFSGAHLFHFFQFGAQCSPNLLPIF